MNNFLFSIWPYLTIAVLGSALAVRYALWRKRIAVIREQISETWALFSAGRVWRISMALLLIAHISSLLFPQEILLWNGATFRLYLLEGAGIVIGIVGLFGCAKLIWRQLGHSERSAFTEICDAVLLSLFLVSMLSGVLIAIFYRWGSSWGVITLTPYVRSIFTGNPAAQFVVEMPFLVRLHVFSAFSILAVIPFTRLASFFIFGIHLVFYPIARPIATGTQALEVWVHKLNPAARIWPEED